jgi:hypothetical protein
MRAKVCADATAAKKFAKTRAKTALMSDMRLPPGLIRTHHNGSGYPIELIAKTVDLRFPISVVA